MLTAVVPWKPVPDIVIAVPEGPELGVKELMVGTTAGVTVKSELVTATPAGVITETGPEVAPFGTTAVIETSVLAAKLGDKMPLNLTAAVCASPVPVIATLAPGGPLVASKDVMVGGTTPEAGGAATATVTVLDV